MDPRKLIKAELAKRSLEKTKKMANPIFNKVKKADVFIHQKMETPLWHYGLRIAFVLHIILTKKLPDNWVMMSKNIWFRVLVALLIVYMAYIDILGATLLSIAFVLLVQESNARGSAVSLISLTMPTTIPDKEKLHLSVGMGQKISGPSDNGQIGLTSYGNTDEIINTSGPHDYENQVGTLGITNDMVGHKINLVMDAEEPGTKYFKVNMGQGMNTTVYDQPASKTLTENLQEPGSGSGFITAKNLLDAQINGAQGAETDVNCAVESIMDSYNAQGLGIPNAFSHDSCPYSKVK